MGALLGANEGFKFSLNRDRRAKAFSTIGQIMLIFFYRFGVPFWILWLPLGSLLGLLAVLLGGLWTQKC